MSKFHIECDGEAVGTVVTREDGTRVTGLRSAFITINVDKPVEADFVMFSTLNPSVRVKAGRVRFFVSDPNVGVAKPVRRIEYADGSVFEA